MAWGPRGETKTERIPITKEQLETEHSKSPSKGLRDFIDTIKVGDEVYSERQGNNHQGFFRYIGKRTDSITYVYVRSSWMS